MNPAYRQAHFRFDPPLGGLPASFGIVTACNPHGQVVSAEENEAADRALAARLDAAGWLRFRVTGGSPDFSHAEPGWGIVTPDGLAGIVKLGLEFRQVAVYWVENGRLSLHACAPGSAPEDLARWEDRAQAHTSQATFLPA